MLNKEEIEILSGSMVGMSKAAVANALGFVKDGFEAFKKAEIPRISKDGQFCYGISYPYKESKEVRNLVDFMIIYLDESIKGIDNQIKKDEENNGKSI